MHFSYQTNKLITTKVEQSCYDFCVIVITILSNSHTKVYISLKVIVSVLVSDRPCSSQPCYNDGRCYEVTVSGAEEYRCDCDDNHAGRQCQETIGIETTHYTLEKQ